MKKNNGKAQDVKNLTLSLDKLTTSKIVYVLFIDLSGSTKFKQHCLEGDIPDSVWILRQYTFLERVSSNIIRYKGVLVKTIGDEVMATFDKSTEPINIIRCCLETFSLFENLTAYNKGIYQIKSKASIDYGECYDGNIIPASQIFDPIGLCVDRCARISKLAKENQIVFSKEFYKRLREINNKDIPRNIEKGNEYFKGLGEITYYRKS